MRDESTEKSLEERPGPPRALLHVRTTRTLAGSAAAV